MGRENIGSKRSSNSISILVVDDDTTCLSLVATLLKKFKYEVVTAKHPNDALCALRIKGGAFDLVVSDVNMPDMNGFELQEAIMHEFNLPVVLMSVDSKEGFVSKGLKSGTAFFISKPVSPNDLKDLWQIATSNMRKKRQLSVNDNNNNKKENPKRNSKKPKVIWTNGLNCRFLEAIRSIGLERSVPKRILEVMNVPGLTRENVASHLQKYRMFLKRVSDASYKVEDGGGLISRNYSVQTLNSSLIKDDEPQFPPSSSSSSSSSSSYQINSLIKDDEPIIPQLNSPYSTTNPSFRTNIDHSSILGQISSELIVSPPFPSTQKSGSYLDFHNYELQNNLINQYLGDSSNVGDYQSIPSPFSSVYDDLLLPSFDTTQQSFNPNHHQLTIQNQAQRDGCEYTENSLFSDDGVGITNSSHDHHQPFYQQVEGLEESLQCDDDDVLESLLAFGEDQIQTLEGI